MHVFFFISPSVPCWLEAWRDDSKLNQYLLYVKIYFTTCFSAQIKPDPVAKKEYFSQAFCESPVDGAKPDKKTNDKNKTD